MNCVSVVKHVISSHLRMMVDQNWMSDFRTKMFMKVSKFDGILKSLLYMQNRIQK